MTTPDERAELVKALNSHVDFIKRVGLELGAEVDAIVSALGRSATLLEQDGLTLRARDAEIAKLREALEPFAKFAEHVEAEHGGWDHDGFAIHKVMTEECHLPTMGAFRRARAALSLPEQGGGT